MHRRDVLKAGVAVIAVAAATRLFGRASLALADTANFPVTHTEAEWHKLLTPEQYAVLRDHGTERPNSSPLEFEIRKGEFACAGCDQHVYRSEDKFDSGTGWPSFSKPIEGAVATSEDRKFLLMVRTEAHCSRCGSHLGHVFADGPPPTGQRYCMNGVAMRFHPTDAVG